MDSPNISIRIKRHESLPAYHSSSKTFDCAGDRPHSRPTSASIPSLRRRNTTTTTSAVLNGGRINNNSRNTTQTSTGSVLLINRRLGATKTNPYIGSFRHAPPTSLRSMEATSSSLSSLTSSITARIRSARSTGARVGGGGSIPSTTKSSTIGGGRGRSSSLSSYFPSSSTVSSPTTMKNSPYVGWFRHAPSSTSTSSYSSTTLRPAQKLSSSGIHKIDLDSLIELDRWHHQLTSLLLGEIEGSNSDNTKKKRPIPLLLTKIINGRLLGGSGKMNKVLHSQHHDDSNSLMTFPLRNNNANYPMYTTTVLSRLTSWLLFPLIYADDECYQDYFCDTKKTTTTTGGLKLISEEEDGNGNYNGNDDADDDDDSSSISSSSSSTSSSASSCNYDPPTTSCGEISVDGGNNNDRDNIEEDEDDGDDDEDVNTIDAETEKEFSEMNVSVTEIAEAYYAHQLIDYENNRQRRRQRRRNSIDNGDNNSRSSNNSISSNSNGNNGYGLSPDNIDGVVVGGEGGGGEGGDPNTRLDYEITQMDIARMTRNASRHLDVDSILTLPTIIYRKKQQVRNIRKRSSSSSSSSSSSTAKHKNITMTEIIPDAESSYHHVCTPIYEDRSNDSSSSTSNDGDNSNNKSNSWDTSLQHSEDGWSFLMVSGVKSIVQNAMSTASTTRKTHSKKQQQQQQVKDIDTDISNIIFNNEDDEEEEEDHDDNDVCVICLDAFCEGDRLRVLPCDHSFHVGCIDRWLSGSHSYNECFTAGCPTCKKLPSTPSLLSNSNKERASSAIATDNDSDSDNDSDMTGSVPSWAFANLGSFMAMSSGDLPE